MESTSQIEAGDIVCIVYVVNLRNENRLVNWQLLILVVNTPVDSCHILAICVEYKANMDRC